MVCPNSAPSSAAWQTFDMTTPADTPRFTPPERALLRHGFLPASAKSRCSPTASGRALGAVARRQGNTRFLPRGQLLARGLMELGQGRMGPQVYFTEAGCAAPRVLLQDRQALNPLTYGHLREELGLEPAPAGSCNIHRAGG